MKVDTQVQAMIIFNVLSYTATSIVFEIKTNYLSIWKSSQKVNKLHVSIILFLKSCTVLLMLSLFGILNC